MEYEVLSNSKLKTWRRCPKQFEFKYIYGLKSKAKKVQLERGSWMHDLLQHHYDGEDWKKRHKILTKEFESYFEEEREGLGDLPAQCENLMKSYLAYYRTEDKQYRVVDTELDEVIGLPGGVKLRIIVDKVVEDRSGGLWIVDYKTGENFFDPDFIILDPQLSRYFWGMEKMGYTPLRGAMFDELRTKAPTLPKVLKNGKLERRQNIQCDAYTYYRTVKQLGHDPTDKYYAPFIRKLMARRHEWFRRTPIPKDSPLLNTTMREMLMSAKQIKMAEERNEFPRTSLKSCRWDCDFTGPCIVQLQGGNIEPLLKAGYEPKTTRDDL